MWLLLLSFSFPGLPEASPPGVLSHVCSLRLRLADSDLGGESEENICNAEVTQNIILGEGDLSYI